jgi:hypothetical protein
MRLARPAPIPVLIPVLIPVSIPPLAAFLLCCACESGPVAPTPEKPPAAAPAPAAAPPSVVAPAAPTPAAAPVPAAAVPAGAGAKNYGGAFEPGPSVVLTALLSDPKKYAEQSVITEGHVQRACSRKGCWMEIGKGDDSCRVTFKDYGFFVPTDSAGADARIQGKITTQRIDPAKVKHLEAEGARFKNHEPDGSAMEVQFVASAVQLTRTGP